ncbi:MAG: hypothetical protein J1F22_04715 [Lachnospiraceae bacterium]|nr:hypothetical protein [Lachnospiraceae bacterium]
MTLQKLNELLQERLSQKVLSLDASFGEKIYVDFFRTFRLEKIQIEECEITLTGASLRVTGKIGRLTGTVQSREAKVTMEMEQRDKGQIGYQIRLETICQSTFPEMFGVLAPHVPNYEPETTLFEGFSLVNPVLGYKGGDDKIHINGVSTPPEKGNKRWSVLFWLLSGKNIPIRGTLSPNPDSYPLLTINFLLAQPVELPMGTGSGNLVIATIKNAWWYDETPVTTAYMKCEFRIKGIEKTLSFTMDLFTGREVMQYTAMIEPPESPLVLNDITKILGEVFQLPTSDMLIPDGVPLSGFGLRQLDVIYDRRSKESFHGGKLQHIRGIFVMKKPMELFVPNLTLNHVQAEWEESLWGQKPILTLFLAASIQAKLGNRVLTGEMTAYYPDLQFTGHLELEEEKEVTFQDLAEDCKVTLPDFWAKKDSHDAGNVLASVDIGVDGRQRSLTLGFEVSDVLDLKINDKVKFLLDNITAELEYTGGGMSFGIFGMLGFEHDSADGQKKKFALSLSADYAEKNWVFQGGLAYGEPDLIALVKAFIGKEEGTQAQTGIKLYDLSLYYDTGSKELRVYATCQVWFDILDQKITTGGRLRLYRQDSVTELSLAAYLQVGVFKLLVQADNILQEEKKYLFRVQLWDKYLQGIYQLNDKKEKTLTFSIGGVTLGDVVLAFVRLINPNARVTLPAPWDIINKISLSDCTFILNLSDHTATLLYHVEKSIAGVMNITDIGVKYEKGQGSGKGSVQYILLGDCMGQTFDTDNPLSWDAEKGNPNNNLATNQKGFHLYYFGLGHHLSVSPEGATLKEIFDDVRKKLSTSRKGAMTSRKDVMTYGETGWIVASDFEMADMFRIKLLFYDPKIYGANLQVQASEKSVLKNFNDLKLDLYYKKISDAVGMLHCQTTLPSKYSKFDLGAITIYLGEILVEIYTNGSFYLDLGFPHNQDFTRSFGITMGIYSGRGGIYLGEFYGDAVNSVPAVVNGSFSTVLKIGIGLSVGLSRSFHLGVVQGGVSLMVVGILEGIFGIFQPTDKSKPDGMYYQASATVGVVGTLFLSADLKVISVGASARISAFCKLKLESYRKSSVAVDLELSLSAYAKVLFFKISFSFHFKQRAEFSFGSNSATPWQLAANNRQQMAANLQSEICFSDVLTKEEKYEMSLILAPMCSVTGKEKDGTYQYGFTFLMFLHHEDFTKVLTLLLRTLCADQTMGGINDFKYIDYAYVENLLEKNTKLRITLETTDQNKEEKEAVIFPILPRLSCKVGEFSVDFTDKVVDEEYMQGLSKYFERLNADPSYAPEGLSENQNKRVPFCGAILADWFRILAEELKARVERCYQAFSVTCQNLVDAMGEYGVTAEQIIAGNPKLKLQVKKLPKYSVTLPEKTSLKSIVETYGFMPEQLWQGVSKKEGLLDESIRVSLEGYQFDNRKAKLTMEQAAALFYVRLHQPEVLYAPYVEEILKTNDDIDMDWECREISEAKLQLPGGRDRRALPGDTVVLLAKECAVLDGVHCDGTVMTFEAFKEKLKGNPSGEQIPDTLSLFDEYTRIPRGTVGGLFRYVCPDFQPGSTGNSGAPENCVLWDQPILRPLAEFDIQNYGPDKKGTVKELCELYGTEMLTEALLDGEYVTLDGEQEVTLPAPAQIPYEELEAYILGEGNVKEMGSMISRVFLQGSRMPETMSGENEHMLPMYELSLQQMSLPVFDEENDVCHIAFDTDAEWITLQNAEADFTREQLQAILPKDIKEDVPRVQNMPFFEEQLQTFTMTGGWTLFNDKDWAYLGMLPAGCGTEVADYKKILHARKGDSEISSLEPAVVIDIRLYRKEKDVFWVEGAGASQVETLYSLIGQDSLNLSLYCHSSPLKHSQDGLYLLNMKEVFLVKTNLSKETKYVKNALDSEVENWEFIANMRKQSNQFVKLLWECTVIGGGYWLYCPNANIPDNVFDGEGYGSLTFVAKSGGEMMCNAVYLPENLSGVTIYQEGKTVMAPMLPAGCVGYVVERDYDEEDIFKHLFQLLGYETHSHESASVMPVVESDDTGGKLKYQMVIPIWKMYGQSPYAAVGCETDLKLFFRDVLGNRLDCRMQEQIKIRGRYNDFLTGVHELPNTLLSYRFEKKEGRDILKICCEAKVSEELVEEDKLQAEKNLLITAYYQYQCEDVHISVQHSLSAGSFVEVDKTLLLTYIHSRYTDLENNRQETKPVELYLSFSPEENGGEPIQKLEVTLRVERTESGPEKGKEKEIVMCADSTVLPADNMAETFSLEDYRLAYGNQNDVYLLRADMLAGIRIQPYEHEIDSRKIHMPEFYAVLPFANGDANVWERQFLEDIERFLTGPQICMGAKECPEIVERLVNHKADIAEELSHRVKPVRAEVTKEALKKIEKLVKDRFSENLALAYDTGVIAAFHSEWKTEKYRLMPQIFSDQILTVSKLEAGDKEGVFCLFLKEDSGECRSWDIQFPYLEYDIEEGLDGYEKSQWLKLYQPVASDGKTINLMSDASIPYPKKECPLPPELLWQEGVTKEEEISRKEIRTEKKELRYKWRGKMAVNAVLQDTLYLELDYSGREVKISTNQENKFDILARYSLERAEIMDQLETDLKTAYKRMEKFAGDYVRYGPPVSGMGQNERKENELIKHTNSIDIKLGMKWEDEEEQLAFSILNQDDLTEELNLLGADFKPPEPISGIRLGDKVELNFSISNLPLHSCNQIIPKAWIVRNADLLHIKGASDGEPPTSFEIREDFIFRTEQMSLPAIQVVADYNAITLEERKEIQKAEQEMWSVLEMDTRKFRLDVTVFYEYPAVLWGQEENAMVRTPVTFIIDMQKPGEIAGYLSGWEIKEGSRLLMECNVYGRGSGTLIIKAGFVMDFDVAGR